MGLTRATANGYASDGGLHLIAVVRTASLRQLIRRPVLGAEPWRTPVQGGHGLAGWHAALSALRREFGVSALPDLSPGL